MLVDLEDFAEVAFVSHKTVCKHRREAAWRLVGPKTTQTAEVGPLPSPRVLPR